MKKYFVYFWTTVKLNTAYQANIYFSLIIDVIFFYISFALWKTIYTEGGINQIDTYSLRDTITYFFVQSILFRIDVSGSIYLNWTIWSGYFTNDLIKPWSISAINILDAVAERFFVFLLYIPVVAAIFLSARQYIEFPNLGQFFLFIITVILAFALNIAFNLILHVLCFYFGDQSPNIELFNYFSIFLAGAIFPLSFLPDKIEFFFNLLPFKNLFFIPIEVFLGKMTTPEIFWHWLETIIWIAVLYIIFKILYKRGLKHYTGTGR